MSDFPIGLREVVPDQTVPEKCKEFIINTGTYVMLEKISIKGRKYLLMLPYKGYKTINLFQEEHRALCKISKFQIAQEDSFTEIQGVLLQEIDSFHGEHRMM